MIDILSLSKNEYEVYSGLFAHIMISFVMCFFVDRIVNSIFLPSSGDCKFGYGFPTSLDRKLEKQTC